MDKEIFDMFVALKEINKLKALTLTRFQNSKEKNLNLSKDIENINERLKTLQAAAQSHLMQTSDFQDKKTLFNKLLEYKNFDLKLSEKLKNLQAQETLIESSDLLENINSRVEQIKKTCTEVSNLKSNPSVPVSVQPEFVQKSSLSSLDEILLIFLFIMLIVLSLIILKPKLFN